MRLFLGIELPPALKAAAATAAADARARVTRAVPRAPIRWVEADNLHITVWFLGEVEDAKAAALNEVLAKPFATRPFSLELRGLGTYPLSGRPRVLWIGLASGTESLVALSGELALRLPALGFEPEKRAYSPHLTLARIKEIRPRDAAAVRRTVAGARAASPPHVIDALTLFRSRLSPHGARYEALLRVPLS